MHNLLDISEQRVLYIYTQNIFRYSTCYYSRLIPGCVLRYTSSSSVGTMQFARYQPQVDCMQGKNLTGRTNSQVTGKNISKL